MSSSDESTDEEYRPDAEESDIPSEAETDYDSEGNKVDKNVAKKRQKSQTKRKGKQAKVEKKEESTNSAKDEEEEKRRTDALWADFLNDTNSTPSSSTSKEREKENQESTSSEPKKSPKEPKPEEETVTKVFDFAGEKVEVVEKAPTVSSPALSKPGPAKKFGGLGGGRLSGGNSGGLSSVLNQLGKKNKISVLEKTKLDWKSYKKDEGIEEELQTFNKGKDGYLERQDFLERTDLRQFEREKNIRQSRRSNR